ncbi:hypothetical protein G3580_15185 [Nitrogeniibacter mangrovi]|uniref:Uncharacterized protein n=1 Tax=Nitrogeniibacter mangrovi TaxID=2016596 RepID=A0A6C1B556_9RHOO|nr:hypothetical protein [Nitrogeniibacter mangrovi]QID18846.1 hypothetical protein G3580_15185 [Nitrogeniibacter mangrovi]
MADMAFSRARFGRADIRLPDPVPAHPLLDGLPEIGRGEYSIVLALPDGARVRKVVSSPADHFFLTADDRPRGIHFPTVFADHGVIGRARSGALMHLLELERLEPLAAHAEAAAQAERLQTAYWQACLGFARLGADMGRIALFHLIESPPPLPDTLIAALCALSDFIEAYQVRPDILSEGNLMARADGTLVFSDPVFLG